MPAEEVKEVSGKQNLSLRLEKLPERIKLEEGSTLSQVYKNLLKTNPELKSQLNLADFIKAVGIDRKEQGGVVLEVNGRERIAKLNQTYIYPNEILNLNRIVRNALKETHENYKATPDSPKSTQVSEESPMVKTASALKIEKFNLSTSPETYLQRASMRDRFSQSDEWTVSLMTSVRDELHKKVSANNRVVKSRNGKEINESELLPSSELLCAIATRETHRRPDRIDNPAKANPCVGILQVALDTARGFDSNMTIEKLLDPKVNTVIATKLLTVLFKDIFVATGMTPDNPLAQKEAVARYNAGTAGWNRNRPKTDSMVRSYLEEVFSGVDYWKERVQSVILSKTAATEDKKRS